MNLDYKTYEKKFYSADFHKSNADSRRFIDKGICEYLRAICGNLRLERIFWRSYKGLTYMEILISILLLSVVVLAIASIFSINNRFFWSSNSKAILQAELGFALDHMQKNIIQGMGDKNNPAVISSSSDSLQVRIDKNAPPTFGNYTDDTLISYTRSLDGKLIYNDGSSNESLCSDLINITGLSFSLENDFLVNIQVTGSRRVGDRTQSLTLYTTAYPRFMSNN